MDTLNNDITYDEYDISDVESDEDILEIIEYISEEDSDAEENDDDCDDIVDMFDSSDDESVVELIESSDDDTISTLIDNNISSDNTNNTKITFPILTKYERCLLLSQRILQLINGSKPCVITDKYSPNDIALLELNERKIPFKIKRAMPNGNIEVWDINEFIYV